MKFSKVLGRAGSTRMLTTGEFSCTYFGWVMLPLPRDNPGRGIEYKKLVDMAKRVAVAQTSKASRRNRPRPEKAFATVGSEGIRIVSKDSGLTAPLLNAAIDTIICMLLSKRDGIAVVVAHTWDSQGNSGIGCDVIRFQHKAKVVPLFTAGFERAVAEFTVNAARRASSTKPASAGSPRRRRSTMAENVRQGGGYMTVESYLEDFDEAEEDHGIFANTQDDGIDQYISVTPHRGSDHYISVTPRRSCNFAQGAYMSVSSLATPLSMPLAAC